VVVVEVVVVVAAAAAAAAVVVVAVVVVVDVLWFVLPLGIFFGASHSISGYGYHSPLA